MWPFKKKEKVVPFGNHVPIEWVSRYNYIIILPNLITDKYQVKRSDLENKTGYYWEWDFTDLQSAKDYIDKERYKEWLKGNPTCGSIRYP